jgi:DNA-binding response OmpR family regulator
MDRCPVSGNLDAVNGNGKGDEEGVACATNAQADRHKPSSQGALRLIMDNLFMQRINVLLVEDDADLRQEVKAYLDAEGYNVLEAGSLKETLETLQNQHVQAVVLDVGLPDGNGLDALPELRRHTTCPIVMMTAWGQLPMRLKGLDGGADYYLVKPVPLAELSTVLASQLRRSTSALSWRTDASSRTLIGPGDQSVHLSSNEWLFVTALRKRPGQIVSREELAEALGHDRDNYDSRRMDMLMRRLRHKVTVAGLGEMPLRTQHGQGYVWEER